MSGDDLYRRLQKHLDTMPVPYPATESGVEIRILERLFSREQAWLALSLGMVPEDVAVVSKRLGGAWTTDRLVEALDEMARRGLISGGPLHGELRYGLVPIAVGFYEAQLPTLTAELQRDFELYLDEGLGRALHGTPTPQMRSVPVHAAFAPERHVAPYDDLRQVVAGSAGPFAVMDCICRKGRALLGEPCRHTNLDQSCLTLGPAAKVMVERGVAREITRQQMLRTLEVADREALVLQPQNTENPLFVCCCCGCCCGVLRSAKALSEPASYFAAPFRAEADPELCAFCRVCETRCQMEAIRFEDEIALVDPARCIGCGLCVTTCATGGMHLVEKEGAPSPPADTARLYLKIYRERFGTMATAKAIGRAILHKQV